MTFGLFLVNQCMCLCVQHTIVLGSSFISAVKIWVTLTSSKPLNHCLCLYISKIYFYTPSSSPLPSPLWIIVLILKNPKDFRSSVPEGVNKEQVYFSIYLRPPLPLQQLHWTFRGYESKVLAGKWVGLIQQANTQEPRANSELTLGSEKNMEKGCWVQTWLRL